MKLDATLLFMVAVVGTAAALSAAEKRPSSLDRAQAEFERVESRKGYRFDAWRKAADLSCQSARTLRICRAHPVVASAIDGQPVRDFMSFACSVTECAWVDP